MAMPKIKQSLRRLRRPIEGAVSKAFADYQPGGSYTTIWKKFQDKGVKALINVLSRRLRISRRCFDSGKEGSQKNRLADINVKALREHINLSIKTANASKSPQNDLGTIRNHPFRRKTFTGEFELWMKLRRVRGKWKTEGIYFEESFKFVGKSKASGGVKYRKKDGNMRPKPWRMFTTGESIWKSLAEFEKAVAVSKCYRANSIVKEHLGDLRKQDRRTVYDRLLKEFDRD
jgi:hypothetical protein